MDLNLDPSLLDFPPDYSTFDFGTLGQPELFDFGALDNRSSLTDPTAKTPHAESWPSTLPPLSPSSPPQPMSPATEIAGTSVSHQEEPRKRRVRQEVDVTLILDSPRVRTRTKRVLESEPEASQQPQKKAKAP